VIVGRHIDPRPRPAATVGGSFLFRSLPDPTEPSGDLVSAEHPTRLELRARYGNATSVAEESSMTRVFYKSLRMSSVVESDRLTSLRPVAEDLDAFIKETEAWINQNRMRIVSITPITGGLQETMSNRGGALVGYRGTAITCGLIVVAEVL
jgi:hypothetical protein